MAKQGLLSKLLFEDSGKKAEPEPEAGGPVFGGAARPVTHIHTPSAFAGAGPSYPTVPAADPQMVAEVEQALSRQSPPAYAQFGALLGSMSVIPDEAMRFKAAASAASTTLNLQPPAIRAAYESRLSALGGISTKFALESEAELKRVTAAGEANLATLRQRQTQLEQELARIGAEAQQVKQAVENQERQLEAERQQIAVTQQGFQAAVESVRAKVSAELDVVRNNINGGV